MQCETKDQAWDLWSSCPLVLRPGDFDKIAGSYREFVSGGFVIAPPEGPVSPPSRKQTTGDICDVVRLVAIRFGRGWENFEVALASILENV